MQNRDVDNSSSSSYARHDDDDDGLNNPRIDAGDALVRRIEAETGSPLVGGPRRRALELGRRANGRLGDLEAFVGGCRLRSPALIVEALEILEATPPAPAAEAPADDRARELRRELAGFELAGELDDPHARELAAELAKLEACGDGSEPTT